MSWLLGFDPGRDKCGVALLTAAATVTAPIPLGAITAAVVMPTDTVVQTLPTLLSQHGAETGTLVVGNQTLSKVWQAQLQTLLPHWSLVVVDEHYSSQEARQRYWQYYPPRGWQALVPQGMRLPPRPVDDIVAVILIERWMANRETT